MKRIRLFSLAILLLLVLTATAFGGSVETGLVIDVRTEAEWNAGHVDGAILIPYEQIDKRIAEVARDKKTPIILYCRSGRRSGIGLYSLKGAGYENVTNLGSVENAAKELKRDIIK